MKIAILKEHRPYEKRVAATPETVRKYKAMGIDVIIEKDAGLEASYLDAAYVDAGATIAADTKAAVSDADIVLKVQRPMTPTDGMSELVNMKRGAKLIAMLSPYSNKDEIKTYAEHGVDSFSLELVPRITRAQSMDVLSSQSNLAGYRAVIDAAAEFGRAFPMMMTAAGTVAPARVMVMGAGVAGLQAIATAKRLGAVVCATDVRLAAKEQVQSLGGTFVMVEDEETKQAETSGGYAKEMSDAYKIKQATLIADTIKKQDIVICTALIPGRKAPRLVTDDMLKTMKQGSVVIDLAAEQGGNCEGSHFGKTVELHGIKVVSPSNIASSVAVDASALYAKNMLQFLTLIVDSKTGQLAINWDDEIIKATALTKDGAVIHPNFKS
ncbi:MAG: Re/Si-specific NAD(P)(+) transhydrogenase subunit alpha [Alphaproteobacteria bacterium]|nr:Re/Si-specific NAD(P)(+) transhydrogenase subunit alpha [Alphaproteobacteria bacterium]